MKPPIVVLCVLAALMYVPVPGCGQELPSTITLTLPSLSWALEIPGTGFRTERPRMAPSLESRSVLATNKQTGVTLSAFLEKAARPGTAKECRDYYWSRGRQNSIPKDQIRMSDTGDKAILEYTVLEAMGVKVQQKNMNVYLAQDGYWMDVHISKALFKPGDEKLFQDIVKGIRIHKNYVPSTMDLLGFAAIHYLRREYAKAAPFYEKALEQEKKKPTVDRKTWKYLVDQLGMSYGMSGNQEKAKEIYEWAIKDEPEYPNFYYNLACFHAETGNKEEALRILKIAFQYKQNVLPGEEMPDPRKDSSFSNYMTDPAFAAELEKLK